MPEVEYLGKQGIQPADHESKVEAIKGAPAPMNVTQLRSFLGLVNYYGKFLANLSTILAPVHKLLRKGVRWVWGDEQKKDFQEVKTQSQSQSLLVHFDCNKPLVLACDASPNGVGAVLLHQEQDGSKRPTAFVSRTLAAAEQKYSQLDKETLAIVYGVKWFHHYLYDRPFLIESDRQPLMDIFKKAIPPTASSQFQRWAITLNAYDYTIQYKSGREHSNADALSRLPLPDTPQEVPTPPEIVFLLEHLATSP